jgi:23S rRNA pseudouridine2605 synthase
VPGGTLIQMVPGAKSRSTAAASGARQVRVFALHKPRGFVVSRAREGGARTVFELLPSGYREWFAVGRLDKDSEGLMLFCDDPRFAQLLMDPGGVAKRYLVTVVGSPGEEDLEGVRRGGVVIDGRPTRPLEVTRLGKAPRGGTRFAVVLHEGRNREIRRLFAAAGFKVRRLVRVAVGPIELGDLAEGEGRELTPAEVASLRDLVQH